MFVRDHFLLLLALLAVTGICEAQIVIHSTDLSGIGASYTWGEADSATFDLGHAGAEQTWTFGSYNYDVTGRTDVIAPHDGPHGSLFPTATRALHNSTPGQPELQSYAYQRVAEDGVYWEGGEEGESYTVADHEVLQDALPLQYLSTWTTVHQDTIRNIPGYVDVQVDSAIVMVDGWGKVQIPYGTYPCLRVRTHQWSWVYENGALSESWEWYFYDWVNQAGNHIVAATGPGGPPDPQFTTGMLSILNDPLTAKTIRSVPATEFSVGQAFPNPFNPSTTISFSLARSAKVEASIFDITGRLVEILANQRFESGEHSIIFDGTALPSGVYFARLHAGELVKTQKMVLLK